MFLSKCVGEILSFQAAATVADNSNLEASEKKHLLIFRFALEELVEFGEILGQIQKSLTSIPETINSGDPEFLSPRRTQVRIS